MAEYKYKAEPKLAVYIVLTFAVIGIFLSFIVLREMPLHLKILLPIVLGLMGIIGGVPLLSERVAVKITSHKIIVNRIHHIRWDSIFAVVIKPNKLSGKKVAYILYKSRSILSKLWGMDFSRICIQDLTKEDSLISEFESRANNAVMLLDKTIEENLTFWNIKAVSIDGVNKFVYKKISQIHLTYILIIVFSIVIYIVLFFFKDAYY